MAKPVKINDEILIELIEQGKSISEIARHFGVSRAAVSQKRKRLRAGVASQATLYRAGQILEKKIDAFEQLKRINDYANELLEMLMRWARGGPEAVPGRNGDGAGDEARPGGRHCELAIKAMSEIREQLRLQLQIYHALFDMKSVAEFQREVLEAIGTVSPEVRDQIVANLQARRALRSSLDLDPALAPPYRLHKEENCAQ